MPIQTPINAKPKKNSLIVCAGTVTCHTVSSMGAGFTVFKTYFDKNLHHENRPGGWIAALQLQLDNFHQQKQEMPAYSRLAKQDDYLGGVATVPDQLGHKGLTFAKTLSEQDLQAQYKEALRGAINDALVLQRPLFIQPLGIGVYGWDPELAATFFAEVICQTDPEGKLDISIPIFNPTPGSSNKKFKLHFASEMEKSGYPIVQ